MAEKATMPVMCAVAETAQPSHRILLVDDEPKLRRSLAEALSLEDWTVTCAASGLEARQILAAHAFDLIILDWMLPDCDGLEIIRQLRAADKTVPVLMITARAGAGADVLVRQGGANDFLTKPFSIDEFLARSRALMKKAPARVGR